MGGHQVTHASRVGRVIPAALAGAVFVHIPVDQQPSTAGTFTAVTSSVGVCLRLRLVGVVDEDGDLYTVGDVELGEQA